MKQYQNESRLLTAVAIMILLLGGWSPGWAEDGYEVVWEHQLPYNDFRYLCILNPYNNYTNTRTFAVSSPTNNFVVYPDSYLSFKVIDLSTGELIRRVVVDSVHDNPDYYGLFNMQLFENDMKLAVFACTGYVYVYDTHSWQLIRQVKFDGARNSTGKISKDGTLLFEAKAGYVNVFNFESMEKVNGAGLYVEGPQRPYPPGYVVSDDNKRIAMYAFLDGWQSVPDGYIIEAYDLETHEMLFHNELKQYVRAFINSDLSRLYQNTEDGINKEYDINKKQWLATFSFNNNYTDFTDNVSKNEKFILASGGSSIVAAPINVNVKPHEWFLGSECGFLNSDDDYVIALRNITDTSATILKIKILVDEVTPVDERGDDFEIAISPNPATDYITINIGSIGAGSNENNIWASPNASIKIYDVMGVLVAQTSSSVFNGQTGTSDPPRIDISNLSTGVYFVKIGDRVEKFVKY